MSNLNNRIWSKSYIYFIIFALLILVTINYIVDPYQQYRRASFYTFKVENQRYLNAGLIKNYDYDSILLGTSMVENFNAEDINNILKFNKTIKLSYKGADLYEEMAALKLALKTRKINNVLYGLDIFSFTSQQSRTKYVKQFPFYLYDNNIFNDSDYLFSKKIFEKSLASIFNKYDKATIKENFNHMYAWQKEYKAFFTVDNVKQDYYNNLKSIKTIQLNDYSFAQFKENFDKQLLPIIQSNQKINYYIFYPPYSILTYKIMEEANWIQNYVKFKIYIFETLKQYKNVKLYDFQIDTKITTNLKNYKDVNHYSAKINYLMLEYISQNRFLVTNKNVKLYSKQFIEQVNNYDLSF